MQGTIVRRSPAPARVARHRKVAGRRLGTPLKTPSSEYMGALSICPKTRRLLVSAGFNAYRECRMARKKASPDFEQSLADLQTLVERLENGELSLEDSLTAFEQGIRLTRDCQGALAQAEQKVQILLERDGELAQEPFDAEQPE